MPPVGLDKDESEKWREFIAALVGKTPAALRGDLVAYPGVPFLSPKRGRFRFTDLFAGIGGFRIALQNLGGRCVFASELDNQAKKTYFDNFGEVPFGDIRRFTRRLRRGESIDALIPDHEVLAAGFPCQPFSPAGISSRRSNGYKTGSGCQAEGQLIFDIIRIIKAKRPEVVFLENVTNFKTLERGKSFLCLKEHIEGLGYSFSAQVVNSSTRVPQRRKRLYIVCFRNKRVEFEFPTLDGPDLPLSSILEPVADERYTISDRLWEGHQKRTLRNLARGTHFTAFQACLEKPANTLVSRYGKDGKECLIPQPERNPRLLTPRECGRLQGFPDRFLLPDRDRRAYRQFGNTVAIPVIQEIGRAILQRL